MKRHKVFVMQRVTEVYKDEPVYRMTLKVLGSSLSFADAKALRKLNTGSEISIDNSSIRN